MTAETSAVATVAAADGVCACGAAHDAPCATLRERVGDSAVAAAKPVLRVRQRYWVVTASHLVADLYPPFVLSLAVALTADLGLSKRQMALLFAFNPIASGLSQPVFAWITDRFDTRVFGPLGLAICAICLSSIGFATSFGQLVALQVGGMIGVGMLHPVLAALAGELGAGRKPARARSARGLALSIFFAAGMVGGVTGPIVATRINEHIGLVYLAVMAIPGVLFAGALAVATLGVPHRPHAHHDAARHKAYIRLGVEGRIALVALFVSNAMRFTVNIGLFYLFAQWAAARVADADRASSLTGDVIASAQMGMGVSALFFGWVVHAGRERTPLVLSGLLAAPAVALMAIAPSGAMHALAFVAALGFFGMIPQSIAAAQRLLPASTGVAGSVMMGCGWFVSAIGPEIVKIAIERFGGLTGAFLTLAILMALAGLVGLLIPRTALERSGAQR